MLFGPLFDLLSFMNIGSWNPSHYLWERRRDGEPGQSRTMTTLCSMCDPPFERLDFRFCTACGTPASTALPVRHEDAIGQFARHESVLQNYRSMFLVSETFAVSVVATRLEDRGLVLLFAAFGTSWLVVWIIITTFRARVGNSSRSMTRTGR